MNAPGRGYDEDDDFWHDEPSSPPPRPLQVIDLEPANEPVTPPTLICGDLLYAGQVHTLSGPPDCGKTTLACWWMLQAIREEGTVLFLDEEGGREIVSEKFQALGAKHGERICYVQFPSRSWNVLDIAALDAVLAERKPALVAWDSSAAFLARAGLDENAAADVTRFYTNVLVMAARRHNAAVLVIDHDTKNSEPSRYARGSGAKLAAVDVAMKLTPVTPFHRAQSGVSKLHVPKDRRGWLERDHEVTFLCDQTGEQALTVTIRPAVEASADDWAPAKRKVYDALTVEPSSIGDITDRIAAAHGHGLTRPTLSTYLNELFSEDLADRITQGNGRSTLWFLPRSDLSGDRSDASPVGRPT